LKKQKKYLTMIKLIFTCHGTRLTGTESITISKNIRDNGTIEFSQLVLRMNYATWQFPNNIKINIDSKILILEPTHKNRNVISGNNVEETYYFLLTSELINSMSNAKILAFQIFKDEVITIDTRGLEVINEFLHYNSQS